MSDEDGSNGDEEEDEGFEIGVDEKVELLGGVVLGVQDPECLSRCSRLWSKSRSSPTSLSYFTELFLDLGDTLLELTDQRLQGVHERGNTFSWPMRPDMVFHRVAANTTALFSPALRRCLWSYKIASFRHLRSGDGLPQNIQDRPE